jgi:hypothetical protein
VNILYREAKIMKMKGIRNVAYCGVPEREAFVLGFEAQILRTLEKRGMLTSVQLDKGLRCLKERK